MFHVLESEQREEKDMASKQERIVLDTARAMTPTGVTLTLVQGGKHPALILNNGTRTVKMPFACSPRSDSKCTENYTRQGMRRALQQLAA
jgi:hypothetical protein